MDIERRVPAADRENTIPEEVLVVRMPTVAAEVQFPAVVEAATVAVVVRVTVVDGTKHTLYHGHIALLKTKEAFGLCIFRKHNIQQLSAM